ncbi:hypothetical protein CDD83_1929 [Cordyceps sp. RAO-2017]|nr:hypothetical protein CDD83_1929 [Cordyceps sp. RAO-2017]
MAPRLGRLQIPYVPNLLSLSPRFSPSNDQGAALEPADMCRLLAAILLTCWHLVFASAATQLLARTTPALDSRLAAPMSPRRYAREVCPIGVFYAGSLVCSNLVYVHLSVAFIQMLKAAGPIAVLLVSWGWGLMKPSLSSFTQIMVIVAGVAMASVGEMHFSLLGFCYQMAGNVLEAVRLVMIEVMLSDKGQGAAAAKMDPLVSLYYYAPISALMNFLVAVPTELPRFQWHDVSRTGVSVLCLNALVAFMLNVASVFLIGKTSGLVMTLSSILKNILLIAVSLIIWNTSITLLQFVGYGIALAGLVYYSIGYDQLFATSQVLAKWTAAKLDSPHASASRRMIMLSAFASCLLLIFLLAARP